MDFLVLAKQCEVTRKEMADPWYYPAKKDPQRMMLEEMLRLQVNPKTGVADYAPVSREVFESLNASLREMGYVKGVIKYEEMIR